MHSVDRRPPAGALFIYGLQHVMAMYVGAVTVPLIVARGLGLTDAQLISLINADLFTCGIATLIQSLGIGMLGIRLPIVQGVTFAAVAPMILIGKRHGMPAVYGAIMAAGLLTLAISPLFSRVARWFPDRVVGTVITLIGLTLLPVALHWAAGSVGLAAAVLALIVLVQLRFDGFLKSVSVLVGLVAGTLVAMPMGLVNTSQIVSADWIALTKPFAFGFPTFDPTAIFSMALVMLVVMIETTGDFIAIGEIVEKPVTERDLVRGLRADGFSTFLGGIFNSFPYTAYAQNVGLVAITGVKSRFVVAAAGVIMVVLGLFPKAAACVAAVPAPVLGGCAVAMFASVLGSGIATLAKVKYKGTSNGLAVGLSLAIGMIPLCAPELFRGLPDSLGILFHSGITLGSLAILLCGLFA